MLSDAAMTAFHRLSERVVRTWQDRGVALKAVSFALIGIVNTLIDASVFFVSYELIGASATATALLTQAVALCDCGGTATFRLIVSNAAAWLVAVTCSYAMNSTITFAAESGRRLRWRDYRTFMLSGVVGAITNTVVLVLAAQVMPVWAAKVLAILVSFVVNFSLSHFVVFRTKPTAD